MTATEGIAQVTTIAGPLALNAWSAVSDFLIIIVLLTVLLLFARYVGRGPFVALVLSLYAGYAVYAAFPYSTFLPTAPALTALITRVALYLGLCFVFYIILRRVVVSDFLYIGSIGLIILSFLTAGFLLALAYHVFPVVSIYTFTPALNLLFAAKIYFFWWFVAPAIGLFFLAR